ncbi:MAG: hypothetical protein HOP32_01025 [Nitrospira sp.]|nr:hypothetical protein [Nitrospira sp.]
MKSFTHHIQASFPPLHEDSILMPRADFIDALSLLDAQKTDHEQIVEIRENFPEPGTLAVRLVVREQAEETED